jgi:hypothetical protein
MHIEMTAEFNEDEDILSVRLGPARSCYEFTLPDGITFRSAHIGNRPHAVVIMQFLTRWGQRRHDAYEHVAQFFQRPLSDVCSSVEAILPAKRTVQFH